jgi:hypothetical protein
MTTIVLHTVAPPKPGLGENCNGCGACCAAAPCPVSRFALGHRKGSCPALEWREGERRYRCGMALNPGAYLAWLPDGLAPWAARACRRWIAAGEGCDFDAEIL